MVKSDEQPGADGEAWEDVLASLCRLQTVLPDAVLVGGTASALYARHRLSFGDYALCEHRANFARHGLISCWFSLLAPARITASGRSHQRRPGSVFAKCIIPFGKTLCEWKPDVRGAARPQSVCAHVGHSRELLASLKADVAHRLENGRVGWRADQRLPQPNQGVSSLFFCQRI